MTAGLSACGQENSADKFFEKYKSQDALQGEISINPTAWLTGNLKNDDKDKIGKKITSARLLILDGKNSPTLAEDLVQLSKDLHQEEYEDLVSVTKGAEERFQVMSKGLSGGQKELIFLAKGKDGGVVFVQLQGRFSSDDLAEIGSSLQDNDKVQAN